MTEDNLILEDVQELDEEIVEQTAVDDSDSYLAEAIIVPEDDTILAEDTVMEVPVCTEEVTLKPRKKHLFWKVLSICFALVMVCTAVGLWFFYKHLENYEAATPGAALNNYIQWVQDKNFEAIYNVSDFEETILNTKEEYLRYLARIYDGDMSALTVREKVTSTDTQKDYSLYVDNKRIGGLTLIKNPEWGETAWNYITELQYQPQTLIYASDEIAKITVNGVDTAILNLPGEAASETLLGGVEDPEILPKVYAYKLDNLLNPPLIEGWSLSGEACVVTAKDETAYHLSYAVSDKTRTEREEIAKEAAFTYAKFVARDAGSGAVLKLIHKESDLYTTIKNFSNYWFTGHDSHRFEDVKISDYTQYSAKDFSCSVYFQPVYTRKGKPIKTAPFQCRLSFIEEDDEWKLVSLINVILPTDETEETK